MMYLQEGDKAWPITKEAVETLQAEIGCNLARAAFDKFREPPGELYFRNIEDAVADRVEAFITRIHGTKADVEMAKTILGRALRLQYIALMRAEAIPYDEWKKTNTALRQARS